MQNGEKKAAMIYTAIMSDGTDPIGQWGKIESGLC